MNRDTAEMRASFPSDILFCSLERWDDVWRRNQFLADSLLRRYRGLRVPFVEPPADPLYDLSNRQRPALPRIRRLGYDGRLIAVSPLKVVPRRVGTIADTLLRWQVRNFARAARFKRP